MNQDLQTEVPKDPYRQDNGLPVMEVLRAGEWCDHPPRTFRKGEIVRYKRWPQFGTFILCADAFLHVRKADQQEIWVTPYLPYDETARKYLIDMIMFEGYEDLDTYGILCLLEEMEAQKVRGGEQDISETLKRATEKNMPVPLKVWQEASESK